MKERIIPKEKTIIVSQKQNKFLIFVDILFSLFIDDIRLPNQERSLILFRLLKDSTRKDDNKKKKNISFCLGLLEWEIVKVELVAVSYWKVFYAPEGKIITGGRHVHARPEGGQNLKGGLRNLHEGWDPERHYVVGHTNPEILGITEYLILY